MSGDDDFVASGSFIPAKVNIHIPGANPPNPLYVRVPLNTTVKDFRPVLNLNFAVLPDHQLLIYNGRVMADHRTLSSYGLEHDGTVDLIEYHDARRVSAYFAEDSVGNLGDLDVPRLENLERNPETVSILHRENTRMRAICDRNLDVLSGLNPTPPPPAPLPLAPPLNMESSSHQLGAGGKSAFRMYQSDQRPPLPVTRPISRVADRDMLPSNPQAEVIIHQVSPEAEIEQMESEQNVESSQTLATPQAQTDGGRGTVPQNDEGTSAGAGGDVKDRFFKHVQEAYADQLSELQKMGFSDTEKNTVTLFGTRGDVKAAVEQLGRNQSQ